MGDGRDHPALTRLGVIGDVHTEADALALALTQLAELTVERVVCTGDLPDGHGGAAEVTRCCELLRTANVTVVSGNHDRWLLDDEMRDLPGATDSHDLDAADRDYLAGLPATVELATVAGPLLLCHGLGSDDMATVRPGDHGLALQNNASLQALLSPRQHRFLIQGHSHRAMVRTIEGLTLINPGTLHRDHRPGYVVADFGARHVQFYDLAKAEGESFALE